MEERVREGLREAIIADRALEGVFDVFELVSSSVFRDRAETEMYVPAFYGV
jgi:hypothetical protein